MRITTSGMDSGKENVAIREETEEKKVLIKEVSHFTFNFHFQ